MWLRIDDNFLGNRKFEGISDRALGFWLRGLAYAARNATDGHLPKFFVRTKTAAGLSDELLHRGLWERTKDGFLIHDFLDFHPSKAEVERMRRVNRGRQSRWRSGRGVTPALTPDSSVTNGQVKYSTAQLGTDRTGPEGPGGVGSEMAEARRQEIEGVLE